MHRRAVRVMEVIASEQPFTIENKGDYRVSAICCSPMFDHCAGG